MVSVNYQSAMGTIMDTIRQRFWDNFITTGAFLTGMVRFDFRELLTGTCSLALQLQSKATPSRVRYTLGEVVVLQHIGDGQVLYSDLITSFKDTMGCLELKILALIRYPFMATGDNLTLFCSAAAPLFSARQYALMFAKSLFRLAIMAGVWDMFTIRIYGKRVKSHVYPNRRVDRNFYRVWHFDADSYIPTTGSLDNGQIPDFAIG